MNEQLQYFQNSELIIKIAVCVVLLFAGILFHRYSKRWITKALEKKSGSLAINAKKITTLTTFLFSTVKYFIYFMIFYIICKIFKVPIDSFFLAVAGASSVAFGLGAQTLVKNIINGFFILIEDQYAVGDIISIDGFSGTVEEIGIRTTKIRSVDGNLHIIPNGEISITTNMTKMVATAIIDINLPYETKTEAVLAILNNEIAENGGKIDGVIDPPQVLGIASMGQYCYTIRITAGCEQAKLYGVERELRLIVKKRLDTENIPMPSFPAL